jgi:hypothetical protein
VRPEGVDDKDTEGGVRREAIAALVLLATSTRLRAGIT